MDKETFFLCEIYILFNKVESKPMTDVASKLLLLLAICSLNGVASSS